MAPLEPSTHEPSTPERSIFDPSSAPPTIEISLTEEQQALIHAMTGEHATVIELAPDPSEGTSGSGRALRFKWRLSTATGIPRLAWDTGHTVEIPVPNQPFS
ncbi:MAG TPA: hypothetical protein VM536_03935 [Chloroflexia bacterium]|nr:hypothetical protein [Chloroflexia bacterium]